MKSEMQINLFRGWPNPSLHPRPALSSAATAILSNPLLSTSALNYGPDDGDPSLRAEIARWLSDFYSPPSPVPASRICITGGASQNLACLLQVFSDPLYTKNVWMVAPTYHLACRIFDDAGFAERLRGVREDEEGLDVAELERGLERSEERARAEWKRVGDWNRNQVEENLEPVCSARGFLERCSSFLNLRVICASSVKPLLILHSSIENYRDAPSNLPVLGESCISISSTQPLHFQTLRQR